ncbi:MAG: CmpA/NrtA family ABC transporter substrate-binding protein [Pseudomonadota bacterium]
MKYNSPQRWLKQITASFFGSLLVGTVAFAGAPEKTDLKFGFIKLTDMAPLAIALEKGFFADEGLNVTLEAMPNWSAILKGVEDGSLDGAHMLPGQPLAAQVGLGGISEPVITPFSMDLNGNGITLSNDLWNTIRPNLPLDNRGRPKHPISAEYLRPVVDQRIASGSPLHMGMVYPTSTHNYELRYWLAAGGINPGQYNAEDALDKEGGQAGAEVTLSVTPPPKMPDTLAKGDIEGYSVGEPWNQQAVFAGIGVPVVTDFDIWENNPEKVFGIRESFAKENPETVIAITKALIRAGKWLDDGGTFNRPEAVEILARPNYVGADYNVMQASMVGTFEYEAGDLRIVPEFNTFFANFATYPYYSDAVWFLTQMRRWGQITEPKSDEWYHEVAKRTYRPDIYMKAAEELIAAGHILPEEVPTGTDGYREATSAFIDGVEYDGRNPNEYLGKMKIGNKQ